ncbi:nitrate reductase [Acinetobacter rathckeae]|uniref:nitrate reductase n=1 Tax=Acinetobacter rathckeae TaxID=2605272 RepID=UPI0018A295B6|nr:nitrate reductase [Acinetobacter rathckeae]MBF7687317.1 molybdopterin-dependent oxidoreductase [Acinetobacter rathckeae]MBF7696152.1 molybdopterin-dependent oxidoreductase [Acinetobacter rathckeae]
MTSIPIMNIPQSIVTTTHTTCPYCGVGCGVTAEVVEKASAMHVTVKGDKGHPSNFGKLCIKGSHLADTVGLSSRLLQPQMGRRSQRKTTTWQHAIQHVAEKFKACINEHGPESIAFYVSGQLLTEDYYVVNKFVKGYLGTANIDTNSRLCMSSAVAAHKRSFGEDIVPASYVDFEHTEMVVLVGSNTAWCHPILFQRIMQGQVFVVVIDPRFTATCESANLHLPILPGQDVCLFNGLLQYLFHHGYKDSAFVDAYTDNLQHALLASESELNVADVAAKTGISIESLTQFYEKFAQTEKVMTLFSMGVNQSSQGVNKANSIINCHLLSGKIGKLGAAPFSMTGQPNAMGGREVGGLSNMLAAHLDLDNPSHQQLVQQFWQSPNIAQRAGLKAVDLFQAIERGDVKAVWIMATNPVVSLPNAMQVQRALEACDFVVVSDISQNTDTTAYADVLLPALAWGEKDGTVTNSERRISRQRAFLPEPQQAKADWWAICQVAKSMGFAGFDFKNSHDIFLEHARLTAYKNSHPYHHNSTDQFRYLNLEGLTALSFKDYQALKPIQWPVWKNNTSQTCVEQLYGRSGRFSHANGRAKFIATYVADPAQQVTENYPLILNTGRVRDQWHTMTRTGLSANLTHHLSEPYCEIHAQDALKYGIRHDALVQVKSAWGQCVLRVKVSANIRRGQVFAPIHWNDQFASDALIGQVVNPVVDAISGEPEFKHTPILVQNFPCEWYGTLYVNHHFYLNIQRFIQQVTWWVKVPATPAIRYELVDRRPLPQLVSGLKAYLDFQDESFEWLNLDDASAQMNHTIILHEGKLVAALYIAKQEQLPDRDWLRGLFERERLGAMHRKALLAGQAMSMTSSEGPLVCSCFKVGKQRIIETIKAKNITHEKEVTACLKAGGNCGSCLPEIRGLIKACQQESLT